MDGFGLGLGGIVWVWAEFGLVQRGPVCIWKSWGRFGLRCAEVGGGRAEFGWFWMRLGWVWNGLAMLELVWTDFG